MDTPSASHCNARQLLSLLNHHLTLLWRSPEQAAFVPPLMIWGAPGVGKSDIVRQVCQQHRIGFVDVRLAQREPVDIRGLPVPKEDGVHWLVAAEWPRQGRGIIFFDELTAADRMLQVAAYELILDRRLGTLYQVPPGWYICAAGNRLADNAVALTMSSALANRFCHLELEPELDSWLQWAASHGVHPDVTGLLRFAGHLLFDNSGNLERGWPTPRSWARVSYELFAASEAGLSEDLVRLIVQGLVGPTASAELFAFRRWASQLPDVLLLLQSERELAAGELPTRVDQQYALCAAAVHHANREPGLLSGLIRLALALPADFATMLLIDYLESAGHDALESRARELFAHPLFAQFSKKHGEVFRARFALAATSASSAPSQPSSNET
jgi:hypothetical protein